MLASAGKAGSSDRALYRPANWLGEAAQPEPFKTCRPRWVPALAGTTLRFELDPPKQDQQVGQAVRLSGFSLTTTRISPGFLPPSAPLLSLPVSSPSSTPLSLP